MSRSKTAWSWLLRYVDLLKRVDIQQLAMPRPCQHAWVTLCLFNSFSQLSCSVQVSQWWRYFWSLLQRFIVKKTFIDPSNEKRIICPKKLQHILETEYLYAFFDLRLTLLWVDIGPALCSSYLYENLSVYLFVSFFSDNIGPHYFQQQ